MKKVFSLMMLAFFAIAISSCEEKKPSEKVEDGMEEVGEGIEDAAEDAGDSMEETAEEAEEEVEEM
jgi:hypothetical protein